MRNLGSVLQPPESPFAIVSQPVTDPVCGMTVDPAHAAGSWEYGGKTWYFCSQHCLEKFRAAPARYAGERAGRVPAPASVAAPAAGITYTCTMHPEIVRDGPGVCPICGMALEPRTVTLEQQENPELADMQRRFWTSLVLTTPVLLMTMGEMIVGGSAPQFSGQFGVWMQLTLSTPVVLWGGWPFFERAWASVVHRSPNMFTLIAMGTGTAYSYSLIAAIFPS